MVLSKTLGYFWDANLGLPMPSDCELEWVVEDKS
jgi:hypothetical protein